MAMARRGDEDFTGKGWKLVWADEFDYKGLPDPKKWDYEVGKVRNQELQYYTKARRENARVEGGMLVIEGRRESYEGSDYTAASLVTLGRAGWQYGRFVVRAKMPKTRGSWPAIWMMGEDISKVGWPRCGEIDVMEFVAHNPGVIHATIHQPGVGQPRMSKGGTLQVPDCSDAFHVYAVEWYPDRLDFFVDDKKYFTFPNEGTDRWTFNKKFYLLINLAIGGAWGGQKGVDPNGWPQKYLVDYVRVYQKTA